MKICVVIRDALVACADREGMAVDAVVVFLIGTEWDESSNLEYGC